MFHGLLLIDKPSGLTSHDVVNRIRHIFNTREVGHAGTLDPMASGLLVVLMGEATKISDFVLNENKSYQMRVRLGVRTDTMDLTGQVLSHEEVRQSADKIRETARSLVGTFMWTVPAYSAAKVNGQKLYQMARTQTPVELPVKEMTFWNLEISEVSQQGIEAHVECSKGSYIRRWASELGERLGCGATLESLRRTTCEPYRLTEALALEEVEKVVGNLSAPCGAIVPLRQTLSTWRAISVRGRDERLVQNGQVPVELDRRLLPEKRQATQSNQAIGVKILSAETGEMLALLQAQPHQGLKICRVFKCDRA